MVDKPAEAKQEKKAIAGASKPEASRTGIEAQGAEAISSPDGKKISGQAKPKVPIVEEPTEPLPYLELEKRDEARKPPQIKVSEEQQRELKSGAKLIAEKGRSLGVPDWLATDPGQRARFCKRQEHILESLRDIAASNPAIEKREAYKQAAQRVSSELTALGSKMAVTANDYYSPKEDKTTSRRESQAQRAAAEKKEEDKKVEIVQRAFSGYSPLVQEMGKMIAKELIHTDEQPPSDPFSHDNETLSPRVATGVTIDLMDDGVKAGTLGVIYFPYKFNIK